MLTITHAGHINITTHHQTIIGGIWTALSFDFHLCSFSKRCISFEPD